MQAMTQNCRSHGAAAASGSVQHAEVRQSRIAGDWALPRLSDSATVFVVDDDRATREALGDLLEDNGYRVELFADGDTFLDAHTRECTGCLIIDEQMPGLGGIEVLECLNGRAHELAAIVVSGHAAVPMAVRAMKAGAVDFLEKPVRSDQLLASVRRALVMRQKAARATAPHKAAAFRVDSLPPRQHEILDLILAGHPSKNIAADLGISQRTVENHRAAIMRATGSKSIPALVQTALWARREPIGGIDRLAHMNAGE